MGYRLRVVDYELWVIGYELRIISYRLLVIGYELWVLSYGLWVMSYRLWVQPHSGGYNTAIPGSFHPTPLLGALGPQKGCGVGVACGGGHCPWGLCGHQALHSNPTKSPSPAVLQPPSGPDSPLGALPGAFPSPGRTPPALSLAPQRSCPSP